MEAKEKVWAYIQGLHGRTNARTTKTISTMTGVPGREVREVISELRREGRPIASAVNPPYGFYVPANAAEAQECLAHMYSRISELSKTVRPLADAFGKTGQAELFEKGVQR